MLHAYVQRFDATKNLEKFCKILETNYAVKVSRLCPKFVMKSGDLTRRLAHAFHLTNSLIQRSSQKKKEKNLFKCTVFETSFYAPYNRAVWFPTKRFRRACGVTPRC